MTDTSLHRYWMRLAATGLVLLGALFLFGLILTYSPTSDLPAFLRGAERVADGLTPYGATPEDVQRWLYAPWFGALLIPLTWLSFDIAAALWHAMLAAALGLSLWPLLRSRRLEGTLAAVCLGAFGFHAVWAGHFEPLMIAMLVYALPTRWGPVAIGVAASLKVTPIILCIRYAARGEWREAAIAVAVGLTLWAPALLYDVRDWGLPIGHTLSLLGYSPAIWVLVAMAAILAAWWLAPTRYGWLAAAIAWLAVLPRMLLYDVAGLLIAYGHRSVSVARPSSGTAPPDVTNADHRAAPNAKCADPLTKGANSVEHSSCTPA